MSQAKITMWGMYNYLKSKDIDLFEKMIMPDTVNKDILKEKILLDNGEFPIVYTNGDFLVEAIGTWSKTNYDAFSRIANAILAEYNPLWNVDGTEITESVYGQTEKTTDYGRKHSKFDVGEVNSTNNTSVDTTTQPVTSTITNKISAFDSEDLVNSEQTTNRTEIVTGNSTSETTAKTNSHSNEQTDDARQDKATDAEHTDIVTVTRQGNIGVTKSTELVASEIDLRLQKNLFQIISDSFADMFCIMVYV